MSLFLSIATVFVVTLAGLIYASFLAARYFFVPRFPDEVCFTNTEDGWRIGVCRYRPIERKFKEPILLVHGIASNRLDFDLTDKLSLAMALSRAGFDTWIMDLRGRGHSVRPRLFSGLRYEWSFDEYAEKDLPAAVREVLRATGAARVHLLGFSIGALACYAYLSSGKCKEPIGSLVSMAGPTSFKRLEKFLSARLIRSLRWLRHRWLMRIAAPGSGYLHPSPLQLIYNPENTDGATQRRAMVNAVANFARNELLQYADWIRGDVFRSIDQRRDYRAELGRIEVPALFIAGARDPFAGPDAVKETFDACTGIQDKEFRICSRAQGLRANYGHFDLLLGRDAPDEIYPMVARWLTERVVAEGALEAERARTENRSKDDGFLLSS
jgi:pimeloyl-ACP methyl ester carboxylesterase